MPAIDSVQYGSQTITSGSGTTVNITITSVDTSRSIVMYTMRSADVNYRDLRHIFSAALSSSTNIQLIRMESASATSIELYWTVVEFDSAWGGSIQTGSVNPTADPTDTTISAVDLDATFPLLYWRPNASVMTDVNQPRPIFTSTTNLRLDFAAAPASNDCNTVYQVVEFDAADVTVQSGTASATNNYSNDVTVTTVDLDKSLVAAYSDVVAGAAGRNYARTYLASATLLEADLQNRGTAPNWNNTWYVIEMLDSSVVESGIVSITNGNTAPGTAPSWGTAMTNGAVFSAKSQPNARITTTGNDNHFPNSVQTSIVLDSPQDGLTITRQGAVNDLELTWQVIEWASGAVAPSGYGLDALQSLVDTSTGRTGVVGRDVDAFQSLAESAYGFTSVNASGFASEALQALTESSTGRTGAVGIDRDAFQSIVDNAGGAVQTTARTGFAAEAFQSIAETATGRTGVVGRDVDALQPLQETGRGITGAAGLGLDSIQPLQDLGFGESGAEPIVVKRGGAPAWWGYEGFDGTKRPWWYKDLKDKAKELERQRQLRIDLGILPPDEDKAIQKVLKETKAFVEKTPTPKNAEQMIAKYDAISSKLELLVDQMEEEEDEQAIMQMSKFFFHRKSELRCH